MKLTLLLSLSAALFGKNIKGETRMKCPVHKNLPLTMGEIGNTTFIGARLYREEGDTSPPKSCNGPYEDIPAGAYLPNIKCTDLDNDWCLTYPDANFYGTLYVHEGCTLYRYLKPDYKGDEKIIKGPVFLSKTTHNNFPMEWYRSLIVECEQYMPSCTPTDSWETVGHLVNIKSSIPSKYTYSYRIGTSWSEQTSSSFSVSARVKSTIKGTFFKLLQANIQVSTNTGYDWNKLVDEAKNEETFHEIETDVPGGSIFTVQQATGSCDGSLVKTELFQSILEEKGSKKRTGKRIIKRFRL